MRRRQLKRFVAVMFREQQDCQASETFARLRRLTRSYIFCMKLFSRLRMAAALAVAFILIGAKSDAQTFGLGVTNSAGDNSTGSLLVSNSLTYAISVTNLIGDLVPTVLISNVLPASVQFLNATNSQGSVTSYGSVIVFELGPFGDGQIAQLSLTVQPTAVGFITNTISVSVTNLVLLPVSTNIVTQVTNTVPTQADLGVTLTGPAQAVIVNDLMTYGVTATNLGPDDAPGAQLTNTLPPGVILISVSPTNQPFSVVSSNLIFDLGTLTAGGGTNLQFTIQPTNAGALNFSAAIGSTNIIDPNLTNDVAATNINVINYLSLPLFVVTNSAQTFDLANGSTEQSILVSNNVGTNVLAVRVVVTNLTKELFNAVGTNNGNPFVVLNTTLPAGQGVNLRLQFAPRGLFPLANSQLQAFGVPLLNLTPPAALSNSTSLNISRLVPLTDGTMLIEFPTTNGLTYTVVYSDNIAFSNAMMALPAIIAPANRLQWIDYGPPTTTSMPANSTNRFYRVLLNP
jgi:uncharacterized repeat protein (TIGR01451 family)